MNLCKYQNIFGKPGEGAHSYRLFNIAIIDVIALLVVAFIINYYTKYNIYYIIFILFIVGIIAHRLFCVRTTIDKILFPMN
jgi:hypothetical protein